MANIRSERRRAPGADMAAYLRDAAPDNSAQLRQLKRALRHALSTVVTPRQRELFAIVREAMEAGARPITLGRRILRTETAGMAVLAMLGYLLEE